MRKKDRLTSTLSYFSKFQYAPTLGQIHMFYGENISRSNLQKMLTKFVHQKVLTEDQIDKEKVYASTKNKKFINIRRQRQNYSLSKLKIAESTATILSGIPQVKLVGLSGSVAMMNAKKSHDIDLFIITSSNNLWTGRLLALLALQLLGTRRGYGEKKVKNKICCNLFFDGRNVILPVYKQSLYTAHEVLQMIPLVSKNNTYQKFIEKNSWVFKTFPNAKNYTRSREVIKKIFEIKLLKILSLFESLFRKIQLTLINKRKTNEIVTETQLWFHLTDSKP
ncbi:hypothetical protein A2690_01530 [Candidatus Roizmanbacteria bacterium RIFCSPHIGHO2_01_FULL_39_12b]|uniref:Polymerase nucleotidyl transferase domain-containing protein n=1 Tax=Candidatus Roizmanbacteria bacterium RIFCSPHIGHO2_01_FULL_39_12b TaxID=1802030 RepID=A0A1F7G7P5_9BACT|nr:MAG: hypothetical protein A2690_01530 [Candidatus Roizmanbacteria bacterium RIFCSPHIGHO2_01_FULL_39_12b]OGK45851.1 MAG: hypothetical protein A3B46_03565 [Candidatus Roizmanbacteria bacterium RIFCSPLOWO2_01_FULL_39_19]